jgi:site-specific DNA-methyltransferase (adenine-specific)
VSWRVEVGDCAVVMASMEPASVDAIVTDPPYGLRFMGKAWDHGVPGEPFWREALRVAKPGAHLVAFGGTRTFHRLTCAIEDAGWEIRDCLSWLYGEGFPKSLDVSKAIDKGDPVTGAAQSWQGWGTALKPAWEPIILARKPLAGTVAQNVLAHGTGALNVDGCRIATDEPWKAHSATGLASVKFFTDGDAKVIDKEPHDLGRWPANVVLDEEAGRMLDAQSGESVSTGGQASLGAFRNGDIFGSGRDEREARDPGYGDSEGASRFFYCAKADGAERNVGLEGYEARRESDRIKEDGPGGDNPRNRTNHAARNHHPTVKPVALMQWLVRLVARPGSLVLDPFTGSGTTGIAALRESCRFVGVELSPEYAEIARRRIVGDAPLLNQPAERDSSVTGQP